MSYLDNFDFAEQMLQLAPQVNFAFNSDNDYLLGQSTLQFFNIGQRCGGSCLLDIPADELQTIGFAYTIIADFMAWESTDVNDIAAENGLYCLCRSYFETKNTFVLPAIFQLLDKPEYIKSCFPTIMAKSFCRIFRPIDIPKYAKLYVLSQVYDIEKNKWLIPTDIPLFHPNKNQIDQVMYFFSYKCSESDKKQGEEILRWIYDYYEQTLETVKSRQDEQDNIAIF